MNALREGHQVSNPEKWKKGQVTANLVALFSSIIIIAQWLGYDVQISQDVMVAFATIIGGIYPAMNVILTVITTVKIGFK